MKVGEKIATLRKECGMTQSQLAEVLECSQQLVASFEKGRCRIPLTALPPLAEVFGVSVEDLLGMQGRQRRPGPSTKLERQLERLSKLPRSKQLVVSEMLDGLLQQAGQ